MIIADEIANLYEAFDSYAMVLILDGDSVIGAPVWSNLGYLICLRHLFISQEQSQIWDIFRKYLFSFIHVHNVYWVTIWYNYLDSYIVGFSCPIFLVILAGGR